MGARHPAVNRRRLFARTLRVFYAPEVRSLLGWGGFVFSRRTRCTLTVLTLVTSSLSDAAMAQTLGTKHPVEWGNVKVEATASSAGATVVIAPKRNDDAGAVATLADYAKVLATRLPRGEIELLFPFLPASVELRTRLKEHPPAFVVSNDGPAVQVQLVASDQLSRTAIHDFVRPVLTSAPARSSNHPGNNLGWDAPPAPDLGK